MIIIETCPECGYDLVNEVICTLPPINCKVCYRCGWRWEEKPEDIKRVPFQPYSNGNYILNNAYNKSACLRCPNNPANGGSGICSCTLGQMNVVYC